MTFSSLYQELEKRHLGEKTKKQGMLRSVHAGKKKKTKTTPTHSPKPQNPLVGITIFLFIYLLIKPVPQLVSGRGRWKKRGKKDKNTVENY